ncbi:MAG: hypothetical protein KIT14_01155 [bacterium]|nr:hypothetical protein [bacterium]
MPTPAPRRLPPAHDAFAIAVALGLGWAFALWAWDRIVLPFANPLGIVGPLTLREFNPLSNLARYLVFVLTPALLYATLAAFAGRRAAPAAADDAPARRAGSVALAAAGFALVAAVASGLAVLSRPFAVQPLDFFHTGEWLTPGWNFAEGRGLWTGSLFIHGAFFDAVGTTLAWDLFGARTIGAVQAFNEGLSLLIAPSLGVVFVALALCASPGRGSPAAWISAVVLVLVVADVTTVNTLQTLNRRDVPLLVGVAAFLFGIRLRRPSGVFVAGTCSALAFFYAIDRGAYFTVATGATAVLLWLREPRALARTMLWGLAGLVLGWTVFAVAVGPAEFRSFVETTRFFMATKDLLDSYVYPKPVLLPPSLHATAPMCIAVQLLLAARLLWRGGPRETVAAQVLVALLAFVYFRSGLGRSDPGHVRYASFFAVVGLAYALCNLAGEAVARRPVLARSLAGAFAAAALAAGLMLWVPRVDLGRVVTAPARLRQLAAAPDDAWLTPLERRVRDRLRALTADDPCFFTFTSEGAWPYLVKKPTCGRYFIVWFVSAAPFQAALQHDLETWRPSHVLLRSPGWPNAIDGIPNAARVPALYAAVTSTYHPVEDIEGFVIGRRADAPQPDGG